jgi:hypothetical protein
LEASLTNCGVSAWQYKGTDGEYKNIRVNGSNLTSTTLYINLKDGKIGSDSTNATAPLSETDVNTTNPNNLFVNDVATIRLLTNDTNIFDVHMITKIYDGAAGTDVLNVTLSNEDMYIPCKSDGTPTSNDAFSNATTSITVYNGNDNITNYRGVSIEATRDEGVSGDWVTQPAGTDSDETNEDDRNLAPAEYKVTGLTTDTGKVTFTVTYSYKSVDGEDLQKTVVKSFYLTKLRAGVDGRTPIIYSLKVPSVAINKSSDGQKKYNPNSITIGASQTSGNTTTDYAVGRYKVYKLTSANGSTYEEVSTMGSTGTDVPTITIKDIDGTDYYGFKIELYKSGSTCTEVADLLDSQTITVISDGAKGNNGDGGLSFNLGDYSAQIACTSDGYVAETTAFNIPFTVYQGIKRLACSATCNKPVTTVGFTSTPGTAESGSTQGTEGSIVITVNKDETFNNLDASNDKIEFPIVLSTTIGDNTYSNTQKFTLTRNRKAVDGAAAVVLRAYATNGNVIENGGNNVTLTCILTEGTTPKSATSYAWYVFDASSSNYVAIGNSTPPLSNGTTGTTKYEGFNTATLTVPSDAVEGYASYRIDAVYGGKTYSDYISVIDKTDPLQVEIFSTLGDKITNSVGFGCIYPIVRQNGVELDPLQSLTVSDEEPETKSTGDVWAYIDSDNQQIVLKKYVLKSDGTYAWEALADSVGQTDCKYTWRFGDYSGKKTTLNNQETVLNRFLYIQGSYIKKKMQFNLEVEER